MAAVVAVNHCRQATGLTTEQLIDEVRVYLVPVLLGGGTPFFGELVGARRRSLRANVGRAGVTASRT